MRRINTCRISCRFAPALMLALHLAGCEPEGDQDLGQAIIHLVRTRTMPDGEVTVTEHTFESSKAWIIKYPQFTDEYEDAWGLWIQLVGVPTYSVYVIFKSPGPDPSQLAQGDGPGYVVSVDIPEKEQGGESPFNGIVHITELSGGTASGDVTVGVDVEIRFFGSDGPPGEIIRVESAEFNGIPNGIPGGRRLRCLPTN